MSGSHPSRNIATLAQALVVIFAVMVTSMGFVGVATAGNAPNCSTISFDGDGSGSNPYQVGDVHQLQCVGQGGTIGDAFELVQDIDASGTTTWNDGRGFEPIANATQGPFHGIFNGGGHTISGLTINRPQDTGVGLFNHSQGGTIEHVQLEDIDVNGGDYTGGVVGIKEGNPPTTLRDIDVSGTVRGQLFVGGIAGYVANDTVIGSEARGTVNGDMMIGGLVGVADQSVVTESFAESEIHAGSGQFDGLSGSGVGGLIGYNRLSTVNQSAARTDVLAEGNFAGGLIGYSEGGHVIETAARGSVDGGQGVGGLLGGQENHSQSIALVTKSASSVDVTGANVTGGLVGTNLVNGHDAIVNNSFAVGDVNVDGTISGGLVAVNFDGTVRDAYWSNQSTGQPVPIGHGNGTSENLESLLRHQMRGLAPPDTMDALDFETTWTTGPGSPLLQVLAPDMSIELTDTNSPVRVGETLEINTHVTSNAAGSVTTEVFVSIGNHIRAVSPTESIPPGDSVDVTLSGPVGDVDPGNYTFSVGTLNASSGPHHLTIEPAQDNGTGIDVSPDVSPETDGTDGETGDETGDQEEAESEDESDEESEADGETTTAVQTSQEDGQTQVQATVQNAQEGESVEMQVSSDTDADVDPDTAPAQLTSVSITPASDATFSLEITESPEPLDSSPEFNLGDGTTPVSYLSVEHTLSNADIQEASMTYRVSEQSLEAMDSSPEDVSMYRYEGGNWVEQPTQVVGMDDGAAILQTTADGLSEWTAAAKRPRLNVTDTEVSVQAATTEEEVTIQVFVTNTGGTDGVYEAELILNEETVQQNERTVPDGGTVAVNFERTFAQPGLYEVQVNDVFVGEVNISAADESVDVETAANASIEAQDSSNASDGDGGGGGGFPVLPAGIVLVLAAGLGIWLYFTRIS